MLASLNCFVLKKMFVFSTSTQMFESTILRYVKGKLQGYHIKQHLLIPKNFLLTKKIMLLLNLRSTSFIGNWSLFFITQLILCDERWIGRHIVDKDEML